MSEINKLVKELYAVIDKYQRLADDEYDPEHDPWFEYNKKIHISILCSSNGGYNIIIKNGDGYRTRNEIHDKTFNTIEEGLHENIEYFQKYIKMAIDGLNNVVQDK